MGNLQRLSKRMKLFLLACMMAFGTLTLVQMVEPTVIHAENPDDNSSPGSQEPGSEEEESDDEEDEEGDEIYNTKGHLEQFLVGLYDVNITIFGTDINFSDLGGSLDAFLEFDTLKEIESGVENSTSIYDFFKEKVYPVVKGVGVSLLTMMMMWKFVKECLEVERFSWERALMLIARTFIVNMFIVNAFEILEIFFKVAMDIFSKITMTSQGEAPLRNIGEVFAAAVTQENNYIFKCIFCLVGMIFAFIYYGTCVTVISQVLVRVVKILVGMAFAPIPMALSVDEQHGTDVLRYIFWMTGCFLQAPILKICFHIYSLLLSEAGSQISNNVADFNIGTIIPICLLISIITGMLAAMINMAQQVTDRIMPA